MRESLHVLLIEDSEDDALLVIRALKRGNFNLEWQRVETEKSLRTLLSGYAWDIIIADYRLPGFDASAALEIVQHSHLDIPFIVVSGAIGEEAAVEMMKAGAHDYFMKDNLVRLPEAVRRGVRDSHVRRESQQNTVILKQQLAAIEAVVDGIAILQEETFLYVNQAWLELYGYDHSVELVGKPWDYLYSAEEKKRFENEIFPILEQKNSWRGEAIATRKDGSTYVQGISLTNMEGGGLVSICRDITKRKQTEQQLKQLNADLSRSNQELGQFAYVASHDLQEPLRKIRSFTELLANRYAGELDETADRYINYITSGAIRMQGLIDDLLAYARVGRAGLKLQNLNLEVTLKEVLSDLETFIEQRNAIVSVDALPTILADASQIRQLFQNLITNGLKYNQSDVPTVHIFASRMNEVWRISVKDNGIGIDPQYSDRIFMIFQRLHNRDKYSGTGIGLALCKKIMERHGGNIYLDSKKGHGSTFSLTLPDSCRVDY